jgi:hypothetical protein
MDSVLTALFENSNVEPWCDSVQETLESLDGADFSRSAFSEASLKTLFLHDIRIRLSLLGCGDTMSIESECAIRGRYADLVLETATRVLLVEFKYAPFAFLQTGISQKRVFPTTATTTSSPATTSRSGRKKEADDNDDRKKAKVGGGRAIREGLNGALQEFNRNPTTNCATIKHCNFHGRTETIAELRAAALEQARGYATALKIFCQNQKARDNCCHCGIWIENCMHH